MSTPPQATDSNSTRGRVLALTAALLGWMFDGFEMGLFPLIGQQALQDLQGKSAIDNEVKAWFTVIIAIFLVGAATGGVVFGWLGDKIGRVRAMALAILTYSLFTGLCGFTNSAWQIAVLRFIAALGMGGEWSLGVALVNEVWPGTSRAFMAGLIGAAANVGYLLVGLLSLWLTGFVDEVKELLRAVGASAEFIDAATRNSAWRTLMVSGALPAILTFFIRLFVPESEAWSQVKRSGATSHWSRTDLIGVGVGTLGALLVIFVWSPLMNEVGLAADGVLIACRAIATPIGLAVALIGYVTPVRLYLSRASAAGSISHTQRVDVFRLLMLGALLAGIPLLGTWGTVQQVPAWVEREVAPGVRFAKEYTQMAASIGAIIGTVIAALVCDLLGRRTTYVMLCITSLVATWSLFLQKQDYGNAYLLQVVLLGATTASFYGWLPLYLPELFPTAVRATSQGFCFNFGRILAAVGSLQMPTLMLQFGGKFASAALVLSGIYILGLFVIWLGPETRGKALPT
jgi:MFS family permease